MHYAKSLRHCVVALTLALGLGGANPAGAADGAPSWIELFPVGGPSGAIVGFQPVGSGYDAANNRLILYFQSNPNIGNPAPEVWVLTNANGLGGPPAWIKLLPSGSPPSANTQASAVYDPVTNRLIVYGGCYANCSPALSDVFVLTNANGLGGSPTWVQSAVTNPQARDNHSAVYDSVNNLMIAFGGGLAFFGTDQNDTRTLSNANGVISPSSWSSLSTSGGPPGVREAHRAVYDQASNRMTIFGGQNLISTCCPYVISDYNDVWVLSNANGLGGSPAWAQQSPSGSPPTPRSYHSAAYDSANNRMIVFGGESWSNATQSSTPLGDLWQLSNANGLGGTPAWTQLAPSGTPPGPNSRHVAAFDAANQRMIVFGGVDQAFTAHKRVWVLAFDTTAPAITLTAPADGAGYGLNQAVLADYSCEDEAGGSGLASCTGDVPDGSPFDTSTVGNHSFTVNAADNAGNTASVTHSYVVAYSFEGFFSPIDNDPTVNKAKAGQSIPVRWRLTDYNGVPIDDPASFVSLTSGSTTCDAGDPTDTIETYTGTAGLQYLGDGNWQFNWKTPKSYVGQCRIMNVNLADGIPHVAQFQFT